MAEDQPIVFPNMATSAVVLSGIDHVVLLVADIERSIEWYRKRLGLVAERVSDWRAGTVSFVSLRVNDTFILDLLQEDPDGRNVDHLALVTSRKGFDDFVASYGADIEMGPMQLSGAQGDGEGVYFSDPDGHRVELRTYEQ